MDKQRSNVVSLQPHRIPNVRVEYPTIVLRYKTVIRFDVLVSSGEHEYRVIAQATEVWDLNGVRIVRRHRSQKSHRAKVHLRLAPLQSRNGVLDMDAISTK